MTTQLHTLSLLCS